MLQNNLNLGKGNCQNLKAFLIGQMKGNALETNNNRLNRKRKLTEIYDCHHVKIKLVNNVYNIACFDSNNNCLRLIFKDRKNFN